jgi:endonuclease/exonuclease/phosphatase family metal-dependent hydrolase
VLVRTWNLFHGNTVPPGRRAYLREMIELATADRPDVVCLQEVPGWALGGLGSWAEMAEISVMAKRPSVGPLPVPTSVGRALTAPNHGLIRSAFAGQGNAILVSNDLGIVSVTTTVLNPARERRVAQRVELEAPGGGRLVVANLHCTHNETEADAELGLVLPWVQAGTEEALVILAGDFNIRPERSGSLRALATSFSVPVPGSIDQVLVRGTPATSRVWEAGEREYGRRLLSDHAPVEARF